MAAYAGEQVREGGTFHCQKCNNRVRANKEQAIPNCRNCGGDTYDERTDETSGR